ncbi:type II toxin-antitoxin system prevent-host-death family antitoxin [Verticiella sediminum]|uniref:Type II toxin-antitoxin system prevent-host-death family antitoxin n=1 Tax=Verticiella sediminum TaxID=1247510 RepID=A0A556AYA3_9BURK|nr:type II toxin-antitoxin system prevent-host-death family antitoxin [Verticiella sediminum]TSH97934.1 type II toxin-antitoxin system prevent-host-death family antitoxin [Verticiella sediminum]
MTTALQSPPFDTLPRAAASDVKKHGWRGVMRRVSEQGKLVITNHSAPEAVVLSMREYKALMAAVEAAHESAASGLDALRSRFDERLAVLRQDDAAERLRSIFDEPVALEGAVKAGSGY